MIKMKECVRLKKGDTVYVPLVLKYDDTDSSTSLGHWPGEEWTTMAIKRSAIVGYVPSLKAGDRVKQLGQKMTGEVLAVHGEYAWVKFQAPDAAEDEYSLATVEVDQFERVNAPSDPPKEMPDRLAQEVSEPPAVVPYDNEPVL